MKAINIMAIASHEIQIPLFIAVLLFSNLFQCKAHAFTSPHLLATPVFNNKYQRQYYSNTFSYE